MSVSLTLRVIGNRFSCETFARGKLPKANLLRFRGVSVLAVVALCKLLTLLSNVIELLVRDGPAATCVSRVMSFCLWVMFSITFIAHYGST